MVHYNFSLFTSNMHYNSTNMSSMAAMHHGHNGLSQQHETSASVSHQHNNNSNSNNNGGSDEIKHSPPPSNPATPAGYASYFGQLAANSVMDNVMCRPVH